MSINRSRYTLALLLLALASFVMGVDECRSGEPGSESCLIDGTTYAEGSKVPAPDGCGSCTCQEGGLTECTTVDCPAPGELACTVYGTEYSDGSAPSSDGCNRCMCSDGVVTDACTLVACSTPEILPCSEFESFESDAFDLNALRVEGDTLEVDVAYGGGCREHHFRLCYEPEFLESFPVQANLRLEHDSQNDACRAYPSETRLFDLSNLRRAYEEGYGSDPATILLRLGDGASYSF